MAIASFGNDYIYISQDKFYGRAVRPRKQLEPIQFKLTKTKIVKVTPSFYGDRNASFEVLKYYLVLNIYFTLSQKFTAYHSGLKYF